MKVKEIKSYAMGKERHYFLLAEEIKRKKPIKDWLEVYLKFMASASSYRDIIYFIDGENAEEK